MNSVLVTGGNGYIGSHLCKLLHREGQNVFIIDNFSTSPNYPVHNYGKIIKADISDEEIVSKIITENNIDTIFHFAAKATVIESEHEPMFYYRENVIKTLKLLNIASENGVDHFVFSSTCATFGKPIAEKIDELHPQNPINTYGKTKFIIEQILKDIANKKVFKSISVLRYFNAAGCDPDGDIGENHNPEYHLIPNLICSKDFKIFGNKFDTPDGTAIRDYVHVDDLVSAHLLALNYSKQAGGYNDFNLGSEKGFSVWEVIDSYQKITKTVLNYTIEAPRVGDPDVLISDSSKAHRVLKWKPRYTLSDCIQHTLKYKGRR